MIFAYTYEIISLSNFKQDFAGLGLEFKDRNAFSFQDVK